MTHRVSVGNSSSSVGSVLLLLLRVFFFFCAASMRLRPVILCLCSAQLLALLDIACSRFGITHFQFGGLQLQWATCILGRQLCLHTNETYCIFSSAFVASVVVCISVQTVVSVRRPSATSPAICFCSDQQQETADTALMFGTGIDSILEDLQASTKMHCRALHPPLCMHCIMHLL